jgi:type II secretory ATPase GspE/PulE/Tfp pilus assembly ATPase PilB-like protein
VLQDSGFAVHENLAAYEAVGCTRCGGGGYRGRIGVYEIMPVSDAIRDLTLHSASADQIAATARAEGMRTLRDDAFEKVRAGVTSIEEVMRVLGG